MVDSGESAEALRQSFHFDHWLRHRDQSGKSEGVWACPQADALGRDNVLGTTRSPLHVFLLS
jgi:hypothetical protein